MISDSTIKEMMQPMTVVTQVDGGIRIGTHCLYPSNGTVAVSIRKQMDSYVISDDRGAVNEANGSGLQFHRLSLANIDKKLKHIIKNQGLLVKDGVISSPRVPLEAIPAVVLLVANASKDAADWMLGNMKFTVSRDFKKNVADLLERHFNTNLKHNEEIVGHSNKAHNFTNVIYLSGQRELLVDAVTNDTASINAKVIANLDIKLLQNPQIIQHVIYDDSVEWKSADIKLLEMGARPLPFSKAVHVIERLAA